MDLPDEYPTSDFPLACFLHATGHRLLRLEGPQQRTRFIFAGVSAQDVRSFYAGATVEAQRLLASIRELKGALHSEARR